MKTIGTIIILLLCIHIKVPAQDSIRTNEKIYDRIFVHGEGTYKGVITYDDKKDSITIVTDEGASTFQYSEVDKVEYNIARAKRESQMYKAGNAGTNLQVQAYARGSKFISKEKITHLRNVSIILSSVGGGLHALGFGLLNGAVNSNTPEGATGLAISGSLAIWAGTGLSIGSIPTWVVYAVKRNKYKRQQEQRQF